MKTFSFLLAMIIDIDNMLIRDHFFRHTLIMMILASLLILIIEEVIA